MSEETTTEGTGTSESPQVESSSEQTASTEASSNDSSQASQEMQASAPPQYTPNYKFKVKDKELDFDDFIKPSLKDAETEKKVRELYEKAYGLDEVKSDRQLLKEKAKDFETKYTNVEQGLKTLGSYAQKKDFRTFFDILNIPRQDIINYALEELKYEELPADQKAIIEAQRQREQEYEQTSWQNRQLQQQMQQLSLQQATFELNQELAKPEVASAITAFETRFGKPGAFRAEVIRRGQYYEQVHRTSPPASQLVAEVLQIVGGIPQAQQGAGGSHGTLETQAQIVQNQQSKPVIPVMSGGGSAKSPVKKVPTSIDDLRKMRQQLST